MSMEKRLEALERRNGGEDALVIRLTPVTVEGPGHEPEHEADIVLRPPNRCEALGEANGND